MTRRSAIAAVLAGVCLLSACKNGDAPEVLPSADASAVSATSAPPLVVPPLDREALLLAMARAASDAALGREPSQAQRDLDGKRFVLRMRFGCSTDVSGDARRWTFDEGRRRLELKVGNDISDATPLVQDLDEDGYEAVEGFWIRRPWLLAADCRRPAPPPVAASEAAGTDDGEAPAAKSSNEDAAPGQPIIGIAHFFTADDARTHRRAGRGYAVTKALPEGISPSANGYDIVVTGRLRRLASGRIIACVSRDAAKPPACLASAQFESVAITNPDTGEILAEWSGA